MIAGGVSHRTAVPPQPEPGGRHMDAHQPYDVSASNLYCFGLGHRWLTAGIVLGSTLSPNWHCQQLLVSVISAKRSSYSQREHLVSREEDSLVAHQR